MIIKEIRIKNFRSYYGDNNHFVFSDGLTLILGDNGDGKTTFFEALQWLLDTTNDRSNLDNVSEMRKSKLEIGESDEVSVYMLFEHNGEKSVEKSFRFERTGNATYRPSNLSYRGYETKGTEREAVNGKQLIDRCYDAFIQHFSMFKGESELDVLDNPSALKDLVDKFSDIRKFDLLVENTLTFEEKSNAAYSKEMKSDAKISKEAKALDYQISNISEQISQKKRDIKEKQDSLDNFSQKLKKFEQNQEASKNLRDIQNRLKTQKERATRLRSQIGSIDYNHSLLDKMWILCAFPSILDEFQRKCSAFSREKRKQERDFDMQQAAALAKLETIKEVRGALINGATGLPWYLPDQETMEEMLRDHICKVCGRTVEDNSDAYHFMIHKIEEYKAHVEAKLRREEEKRSLEKNTLFICDYVEDLHNFSMSFSGSQEAKIASIANEIKERLSLVEHLRTELKTVEDKIQDISDEKTRLLIQAGNIPESMLEIEFENYKGLSEQRRRADVRLSELKGELNLLDERMKELQERLDALNPASAKVKTLRDVHRVLEEISKAFQNAKKENLRRFLAEMEERANQYIVRLSASDFHGEIRLVQTANDSTEIHLYSSNGTKILKPSGSQRTVMYISVLFAISDFTQQKREEDYPLIFDAATSSFGDSKEGEFYNVISNVNKQCIIVTKDFISKGEVRKKDIQSLECPVYRIKKAEGFDQHNMATIRTIVEKLK